MVFIRIHTFFAWFIRLFRPLKRKFHLVKLKLIGIIKYVAKNGQKGEQNMKNAKKKSGNKKKQYHPMKNSLVFFSYGRL